MNRRLYTMVAGIGDEQWRADRGAFFRSIHGTLNHLMPSDRLWVSHWAAQGLLPAVPEAQYLADEFDRLDIDLYPSFDTLHAARRDLDDWLVATLYALPAGTLNRESVETWPDGRVMRRPMWVELQHLFSHQTHHRGQVTTLLMQAGIDPGVTDIVALPSDG